MFTRPPSEKAPPPYVPGYIAYPLGGPPNTVAEEARLFRERVQEHRTKVLQEQEDLERAKVEQTAADKAWQEAEAARRARLEEIREAALRAEIEWERMGGRRREMDVELRKRLDDEACLTDEERALRRAWEAYDRAWDRLVMSVRPVKTFTFRKVAFSFADVPWPVLPPLSRCTDSGTDNPPVLELEDITTQRVAQFLLHPHRTPDKSRKEKLRDAILRYHPDKFEGRILPRILSEDRTRVQEGVSIVMRCLNELMSVEQ
jgi:hypothetical protein